MQLLKIKNKHFQTKTFLASLEPVKETCTISHTDISWSNTASTSSQQYTSVPLEVNGNVYLMPECAISGTDDKKRTVEIMDVSTKSVNVTNSSVPTTPKSKI